MGSRTTHASGPDEFRLPGYFYGYAVLTGLGLFFLYVWLRIEPAIEYQHSAPVFLLANSFFSPFLKYPGGLLDYASAFLSQLNYYGWLGALVYALLAVSLCVAARALLLRSNRIGANSAPFLIIFLLLLIREQYDCPALALSLGALVSLAGAAVCCAIPKPLSRVLAVWVLAPLVFYCAGVWPCVLLLLLMGLVEGRQKRFRLAGLFWAPLILAAGIAWLRWADLGAFLRLNPGCQSALAWILVSALYGTVPLLVLLPEVRSEAQNPKPGKPKRGSRAAAPAWYRRSEARLALSVCGFLIGWLVVWMGLAESRKQLAELDYDVGHRDYTKAIQVAARVSRAQMDVSCELRLQLALYHTGRLGDDLFSYRNQTSWDPLPGLGGGLDTCRAQSRILLELGLVSEAEHLAHEALETEGERPELLRTLAEVNILKGRPAAARVFLNVLGEVPFWKRESQTWLRGLETDPQLRDNLEVAGVGRLMLTNDLAHQAFPVEGMLVQLLRCNPTNQMAFEYLMSEYLVNLQVDKVVNRLWELDSLKYTATPRHYEEALLLYEQGSGSHIELRGREVRPETAERFRQFNQAMTQKQFSNEAGRKELAARYGNTYWYYYFARRGQPPRS